MRTSYPTTQRCTRPPETIDPPPTIESSATPMRSGSANTNFAGGYCCCQVRSGQSLSYKLKIADTETRSMLAPESAAPVPTYRQSSADFQLPAANLTAC